MLPWACVGQVSRSKVKLLESLKDEEIDNVDIRYDKRGVGEVLKGYLHFKKSSLVSGLGRVER